MSKAIALMKDAIMSLNSDIIAVKHDASTDTYTAYGEEKQSLALMHQPPRQNSNSFWLKMGQKT